MINPFYGHGHNKPDIVFLKLEPSKTDMSLGYSFTGVEGNILKAIMFNILPTVNYYMMTAIEHPFMSNKQIILARPNVLSIIKSLNPKVVMFVGKEVEKHYAKHFINYVYVMNLTSVIIHPSMALQVEKSFMEAEKWLNS